MGAKLGAEATLEESMPSPTGYCPPGPQPAGRHRGVLQPPETASTWQGETRSSGAKGDRATTWVWVAHPAEEPETDLDFYHIYWVRLLRLLLLVEK